MSGVQRIKQERQRQIKEEGWTAEHDDQHYKDHLALAAACYAIPPAQRQQFGVGMWPWAATWWKPGEGIEGRIRELAKAGALIAAEIDRLERKLGV